MPGQLATSSEFRQVQTGTLYIFTHRLHETRERHAQPRPVLLAATTAYRFPAPAIPSWCNRHRHPRRSARARQAQDKGHQPGVVHPPAKHRQYAPPLPLPPSPTLPYPTTCPSARTHTQTLPQHPPRAAPLSQNLWFPALKCVGANDVAGGDHHKDRAPRPGALELGRARARSRTRARVFARRRRTRILQGEAPAVR